MVFERGRDGTGGKVKIPLKIMFHEGTDIQTFKILFKILEKTDLSAMYKIPSRCAAVLCIFFIFYIFSIFSISLVTHSCVNIFHHVELVFLGIGFMCKLLIVVDVPAIMAFNSSSASATIDSDDPLVDDSISDTPPLIVGNSMPVELSTNGFSRD